MLLVEDQEPAATLVRVHLRKADDFTPVVSHATTLKEACATAHASQGPELILLDLNLPDSTGIDTVLGMVEAAPDVPIVVLTGMDDGELAIQAVRRGAQDYVVKGTEAEFLLRAIRYALARNELRLMEVRRLKAQARERAALEGMGLAPPGQDARRLRERDPAAFEMLAADFASAVDRGVRETQFDIDPIASDGIRDLATRLFAKGAGPRDVLDIFLRTQREHAGTAADAYASEGRVRALELMGSLAGSYRALALKDPAEGHEE